MVNIGFFFNISDTFPRVVVGGRDVPPRPCQPGMSLSTVGPARGRSPGEVTHPRPAEFPPLRQAQSPSQVRASRVAVQHVAKRRTRRPRLPGPGHGGGGGGYGGHGGDREGGGRGGCQWYQEEEKKAGSRSNLSRVGSGYGIRRSHGLRGRVCAEHYYIFIF